MLDDAAVKQHPESASVEMGPSDSLNIDPLVVTVARDLGVACLDSVTDTSAAGNVTLSSCLSDSV